MTLFERLQQIRIGGAVERCHTVRHQGSYSVAAHSWGVAAIMHCLWPEDFPRLALYCLFHDVPEGWVGDAPAPVKYYEREVKAAYDVLEAKIFDRLQLPDDAALSKEDRRKLKAADHLELYFWSVEQMQGGNMHARCVTRALDAFFLDSPLPQPADQLLIELKWGWTDHSVISNTRRV